MRSEGFSFYTLGVWGLRCVRWMPLLCPQPFATVCNRLQPSATVCKRSFGRKLAVPLGSFTGVVIFGRFTCLQPSFRVAGVALRDMWTCLATCWKSFFVAGAILLQRFQKMRYIFRGRRSTLDVSDSIFRGRRSTSDVSCSVFFANRIGTAARKWQPRANSVAGVAFSWHVSKLEEVSHEMLVLRFARVSWRVSGCAVTMGEAAMPYVWECVKVWKFVEVSHEMLVLMLACVWCCVSGCALDAQ